MRYHQGNQASPASQPPISAHYFCALAPNLPPSRVFSREAFHTGFGPRGLRSRRCGRTDEVSRTRIVIGSHAALPELRRRRAKAEGSVAAGLLVVTVRPAAPGAGTADMPRYAQLVMGPAGSGKVSTWREKSEFVGGRGFGSLGGGGVGCGALLQSVLVSFFVVLKRE